jgi:hypothetical protein
MLGRVQPGAVDQAYQPPGATFASSFSRLGDVEGLDEHLPGRVVDAENSLVLLNVVLALLGNLVGF